MANTDLVANLLNISAMNPNSDEIINEPKKQVDDDFVYARENIINAIEKAKYALISASVSADTSRNSRDYRVLHEIITSFIAANKELLELHKNKLILDEKGRSVKNPELENKSKITNNLFVGSTKELSEMLKSIKNSHE